MAESMRDCRARWPNDSLAAPDGGAGGLAHGYSALIRGINSVKNPSSGYDAARDCQIILVSPVYVPSAPTSEDWSNALELWRNIAQAIARRQQRASLLSGGLATPRGRRAMD